LVIPVCTKALISGHQVSTVLARVQVAAGVSAGTSVYLFTHPWVNDFFTSLQGQPRDQIRTQVRDYLAANPQEQAELQDIRQPMVDLRNRCGSDNVPTP
jgi:hemophore-related protein